MAVLPASPQQAAAQAGQTQLLLQPGQQQPHHLHQPQQQAAAQAQQQQPAQAQPPLLYQPYNLVHSAGNGLPHHHLGHPAFHHVAHQQHPAAHRYVALGQGPQGFEPSGASPVPL